MLNFTEQKYLISEVDRRPRDAESERISRGVAETIRMAWREYRDAGYGDRRINDIINGIVTTVCLQEALKEL